MVYRHYLLALIFYYQYKGKIMDTAYAAYKIGVETYSSSSCKLTLPAAFLIWFLFGATIAIWIGYF